MKKRFMILLTLSLLAVGCRTTPCGTAISMILPSGTPLFGLSSYVAQDYVNYEMTDGGEALISEFTANTRDVIVAPINVGANMYTKTGNYVLFETYVWGNLYAVSTNEINSFNDLDGKKIAIFGTNQTPDIIMQTLAKVNNISYEKELTDSVASSTALFNQGQVEYFIAAEPSLSKLRTTRNDLHILDLQEEWKKITQSASYPQAGIFVKKSRADALKDELKKMRQTILDLNNNVDQLVKDAMAIDTFKKLGEEALETSLPYCHFGIEENQREAIEFYFNKLIELKLEKTFGGQLPNEEFYLSI